MINLKKIPYFFKILFENTENPISLLLVYFGLKNNTKCKLKNNFGLFEYNKNRKYILGLILDCLQNLKIKNDFNNINLFKTFVSSLNDEFVIVDGIKFLNNDTIPVLLEYFYDHPYFDDKPEIYTNMENRIVIDIGGNIADTSLFYAKRGATVYAFEPIPPVYDIAIKNIELNPNLKNKIYYYNKAISNKKGIINIFYQGLYGSSGATSFKNKEINEKVYEIESLTINDVIKNLNIAPDILKIDCEGCEYSIIKNSDVSMFNDIFLEYHAKIVGISYNVLVNKLKEQGFKINQYPTLGFDMEDFGIIHAYK